MVKLPALARWLFYYAGAARTLAMSDPKKGRLVVPSPHPSWVLNTTQAWRTGVAALDNKTVFVIEECTEAAGPVAHIPGWMVKEFSFGSSPKVWVPQEWVHLEPTSVRQPCNCPLALVLRRGCQDPAHE